VWRPAIDEIRRLGEVRAWIDVPILCRGHDRIVAGVCAQVIGDGRRDRVAARDRQLTALAKRGLHVDYDQGRAGCRRPAFWIALQV